MPYFNRMIRRAIIFVIYVFAMMLPFALPVSAQEKDAAAATTAVKDAAKKGFPLTSSSPDVTGNISVEATLIPANIAKTVFGKEIALNYAVIALTISNRSSDQSFIVHTVFIDYGQWLLNGSSPYAQQQGGNPLQTWQQRTTPNQIDRSRPESCAVSFWTGKPGLPATGSCGLCRQSAQLRRASRLPLPTRVGFKESERTTLISSPQPRPSGPIRRWAR